MEDAAEKDGKNISTATEVRSESTSPLRDEYSNAKARLNQQTATFRAFAKEGQRMLRITLVFIGLLLTAVSALGTDVIHQTFGASTCAIRFPVFECWNIDLVVILSGVSLAGSAVFHGLVSGNEARGVGTIGTPEDISSVLSGEAGNESLYLEERLQRYNDRIERNDAYISHLEGSLALGKIAIIVSILGLTVVTLAVTIGPIPVWATVLVLVVLLTVALWAGRSIPDQVLREDTFLPLSRVDSRLLLSGERNDNDDDKSVEDVDDSTEGAEGED